LLAETTGKVIGLARNAEIAEFCFGENVPKIVGKKGGKENPISKI